MHIERLDRLLTIKQITAEIGISRSTIYRLTRKGVFPKPIPIGDRGKRWPTARVCFGALGVGEIGLETSLIGARSVRFPRGSSLDVTAGWAAWGSGADA